MDTTIKALIMKIASAVYAIVVNGRSSVAIDAASTKTMQVEQRTNHNYPCVEGSKHLFCPQRDPSVCEVYGVGTDYDAGHVVTVLQKGMSHDLVYQCTGAPFNQFCGMVGYEAGKGGSISQTSAHPSDSPSAGNWWSLVEANTSTTLQAVEKAELTNNYYFVDTPNWAVCGMGYAPLLTWAKIRVCSGTLTPGIAPVIVTPSRWSGIGCLADYVAGAVSIDGNGVTVKGIDYKTAYNFFDTSGSLNIFCGMAGYQPKDSHYCSQVWTNLRSCDGTSPFHGECPSPYVYDSWGAGSYILVDKVEFEGMVPPHAFHFGCHIALLFVAVVCLLLGNTLSSFFMSKISLSPPRRVARKEQQTSEVPTSQRVAKGEGPSLRFAISAGVFFRGRFVAAMMLILLCLSSCGEALRHGLNKDSAQKATEEKVPSWWWGTDTHANDNAGPNVGDWLETVMGMINQPVKTESNSVGVEEDGYVDSVENQIMGTGIMVDGLKETLNDEILPKLRPKRGVRAKTKDENLSANELGSDETAEEELDDTGIPIHQEEYGTTLAIPSRQSTRRLEGCSGAELYTFKRKCAPKWSAYDDACTREQEVKIECFVSCGTCDAWVRVIFDNRRREQRWWCANHHNKPFHPDRDWNRIDFRRPANERGIQWRTYDCEDVQRIGGTEFVETQEVTLKASDGNCLKLPPNEYSYGVDEDIASSVCDGLDKERFYLERLALNKEFKLRPYNSVEAGQSICLTADPTPQTNYCSDVDASTGSEGKWGVYSIFPKGTQSLPPTDYTVVQLLNAVAGGMKYLRLESDSIYGYHASEPPADGEDAKYGKIHFNTLDYDSKTKRFPDQDIPTSFHLSETLDNYFLLRPRGTYDQNVDACLMAKDPLSLQSCRLATQRTVKWKVHMGQVVSGSDENLCITHRLTDEKGVLQQCSDDANSFVSIVPIGNWEVAKFDQIADIFPASGIQLSGNDNFSSIMVRPDSLNVGISMTSSTVIAFKFVVDLGTLHQVCVVGPSSGPLRECFNLAGTSSSNLMKTVNGEVAQADVTNEYIIRPATEVPRLLGTRIEYIVFRQDGVSGTRSRFSDIESYDMVEWVVRERLQTSVRLMPNFPDSVENSDLPGMHFHSTVFVQDLEGNYQTSVPNAEKLIQMHATAEVEYTSGYSITLTGLMPGRRFLIRLNPVQSTGDPYTGVKSTLKAMFEVYTSCSCNSDEVTGQPRELAVIQSNGKVSLEFTDYSVCEDAYAFTRQLVGHANLIAYVPNYFFYSTQPCSQEHIKTPDEYSDMVSNLVVGNSYNYCTSAVAKQYMVNTTEIDGSFTRASSPACVVHVVMWEASVVIKVTLKKEAGSLPVKNVQINWELHNPNTATLLTSGSGLTLKNGEFMLTINNVPNLDSDEQYPLSVRLSKSTGDVQHEFLCDDGKRDCSDDDQVAYLTHLHFGQVVNIEDKTSVPFRGKIDIAAPPEHDMIGDNCPLSHLIPLRGATVCLVQKSSDPTIGDIQSSTCYVTGLDGMYEFPVTLGTTVYPVVSYGEPSHDFRYIGNPQSNVTISTTGFTITETGYNQSNYEGHDFTDMTTQNMIVEVAGGLCNIPLGTSTLMVKFVSFPDCHWKISQDGYQGSFTMPAHKLSVYVYALDVNGDTRANHLSYLQRVVGTQIVDLTDIESNSTSGNSTDRYNTGTTEHDEQEAQNRSATSDSALRQTEAAAANLRTARFQYVGATLIIPEIESGKDQLGASCGSMSWVKTNPFESTSTHVIKTGALFELAVIVRLEILPDEKVFCDNLGSDDFVTLINRVGLREDVPEDNTVLMNLKKGGTDVSNYIKCSTGCSNLAILPPRDSFGKSFAPVLLQAGIPNPTGDFNKFINIQYRGNVHTMEVIVTGDKSTGGVPFSMPTHFPMLVIRDPPGGSSFASYENMQHSTSITMETYEKYQGIDGGITARINIMHSKSEICAGLGAMACVESVETDNYLAASVMGSGTFLSTYHDDSYSHGFQVTWSYTTSSENDNPGQESDVILVPVITIKYVDTQTVLWNATTCTARVIPSVKINLSSPENQRAFSVITTYHAKYVEIPRLKKIIDIMNSTSNTGSNETASAEFNVTLASYRSWQQFMRDYDETGDNLLNVGEWFNWFVDNRIKPNCTELTQTWECTHSTFSLRNITTKQHMCDPPDPNLLASSFDTGCRSHATNGQSRTICTSAAEHFSETGQPICGVGRSVNSHNSSGWVPLPESHKYWREWSFYHPIPTDKPRSGLVPNTLLDDAEINTETENFAQALTKSSLESTGRIIFSGGGGEFTMTLGSDHLKSIVEKYSGRADIGDFDNAQQGFSAGVEGGLGGSVMGIGLQVTAEANYHYDIDHKVLSATEILEETSVSFSLSDPDVDDEFHVDIFFDPKYGTFAFRTVGGRSKCPHELNTERIESPKIIQIWPPGAYILPDEVMEFDVLIQNDGLGDSVFNLYAEAADIQGGLQLDMPEDEFFLPSTATTPNATTLTTVTVSRGPKLYSYNPVRLSLRSSCEERARARAVDGTSATIAIDWLNNVGATKDGKIEFLQPCPEIRIVGPLQRTSHFIINGELETNEELETHGELATTMAVQVFNPLYGKEGNFTSMKRAGENLIESIKLKYRKVGQWQWLYGQHELDGVNVEMHFEVHEDSYGYSDLNWYVESLSDAVYEIQVQVKCRSISSLPEEMNSFSTAIIRGQIDRKKPSIMGYPYPQVNLVPGNDLIVEFTEDIWCAVPFVVTMIVSGLVHEFENGSGGSLQVVCSSNRLAIQVAKDLSDREGYYDNLLGRNYILTIMGVKDLNGNVMEDFVYSSHFICLPPVPKLSVHHTAGNDEPYLPEEKILFEVTLSNEARDMSYLELGVDSRSNTDNLEILVNGESIAISHKYILEAKENTTTVVSVGKGPGKKLHFDPITIFLRSTCNEDSNKPVEVTAELWNHLENNHSKSLLFQHPCPPIRWAGQMNEFSHFMFNNGTLELNSLLEVSIFNIDYMDRKLFDRSRNNSDSKEINNRLDDVVLLYRRVGDWNSSNWELGRTLKGDSLGDFSMKSLENSFGYSMLDWDVSSLEDSIYEVKVMSRCSHLNNSHDELDNSSTETVHVVLDRKAPSVYGVPSLQLPHNFHPSHEFVIPFTEELYCEKPYTFNFTLTLVSDSDRRVLQNDAGLHVKCEGMDIKYKFDAMVIGDYGPLANSAVAVELEGVEDMARNNMSSKYETSYIQCNQALSGIRLYVGMGCDQTDNDCDLLVDECDEDLIAPTMTVPNLLKVLTNMSDANAPVHTLRGPICFSNTADARQFLLANIKVSDDCSPEVRLNVEYNETLSIPELAFFLATATDERCEGGNGTHVHSEIFKVEIFDGYDTQGLLSDNTVVRGMGCDRADQNCNGIVDDCDEDLVPPTIYMSEGVTLTELQDHLGKEFVTSHCFDKSEDVALFLEKNAYAEDDCAKNITIDITEVSTDHSWKKNHKYNLAEYLVKATDGRCGDGEHWSVNTTYLVEVFDKYDEDVKQQGCNGFDENCDGIVDDCSEDRSPPVIFFREALTVSAFERDDGITIIDNPAFATLEAARKYLTSIIKAEDDCAQELLIAVSSPPWAECADTKFTVTVMDRRCSSLNPLQTVTKYFLLKVDLIPPTVSIGFDDPSLDPSVRGKDLRLDADTAHQYLHVDQAELRVDYVNTHFWYNVEDNCPQQTNVEILVSCNEFGHSKHHNGEMVLIKERKNEARQSHKLQIFVIPEMCVREPVTAFNHDKILCDWDPNTAPVRFYEIEVKVTDFAGNYNSTQASVIVLQEGYRQILNGHPNFGTQSFFLDAVKQTPPQNIIGTYQFHWEILAGQVQSLVSTSTGTSTTSTVAVSSTLVAHGIPDLTQEDEEAVKSVVESSIREILRSIVAPTGIISEVVILRIGNRSRRLQTGRKTPIEYTFVVVDSGNNTGSSLLQKLKETMEKKVSDGGVSESIKKHAIEDGVDLLNAMSIESATPIEGNFTDRADPMFSFKVPGRLLLIASSAISEADPNQINAFFAALKREGCPKSAIKSCSVMVLSMRNKALPNNGLGLLSRKMQESTPSSWDLGYELLIDVLCNSDACSESQTAASAIYDQITSDLRNAYDSGLLIEHFQAATGISFSAPEIASSSAGTDTTISTAAPNSSVYGWYPDEEGNSGSCSNDTNAPLYMRANTKYFSNSLEKCCELYYSDVEEYATCTGNTAGWFPNWNILGSGFGSEKCLNDADLFPSYMIQFPTLELCCREYYQWDIGLCITQSGGKFSDSATMNWYIDWKEDVCKQSCLQGTGQAQAGADGLHCGGIAPETVDLHSTVEDCCEKEFVDKSLDFCVSESTPPNEAVGTTKWSVSYVYAWCVQDCEETVTRPTCGGVVEDSHVELFITPLDCCARKLGWIPSEICRKDSMNRYPTWVG